MNRYLLSVLFIALLGSTAWSQDIRLGPRAGLSTAFVSVDADGDFLSSGDNVIGVHAGVFGRVGIKSWYVQPEVLYTFTGGEQKNTLTGNNTITFNRVDIPIMIGKKFAKIARVNAGPVASFLLSANSETAGKDEDVAESYKSSIFGLQFGVGVDLWKLVIDVKYETSLGNMVKDDASTVNLEQRQNQIMLSVGYNLLNL